MIVYTWILISLIGLGVASNLFAPLDKVGKPETMSVRGGRVLFGAAMLVYLVLNLP